MRRVGSPSGTRRPGPSSGPRTAWDRSSPWHSTRTGPCSPSPIRAEQGASLGPCGGHADHAPRAERPSVASLSRRTASGWPHWATMAASTLPTPGPATRCWCSAASARPPAAAARRPRLAFSPDGSRIAANSADSGLNLWDLGPAVGPGGRTRGRRRRGLAPPQPRPGRARRRRGRRGGLRACPRDPGHDPSPWIEHAISLYRRGDSYGHGTPWRGPWRPCPTTRRDGSTSAGGSGASAGRRSRRRSWRRPDRSVERRLSRAPDDEAAAAALAELLPDADESRAGPSSSPT